MEDFLKITQEDLDKANSGGMPKFEHGDDATFLIEEIKDTKQKDGKKVRCVGCKIIGGKFDGKIYTHFIKEQNKSLLVSILKAFYKESEILSGNSDITSMKALIGKKMKSTAVNSRCKKYRNFYDFYPVSDVPEGIETPVTPTEDKIKEDVKVGSELF